MTDWNDCRYESPRHEEKIEVIGYWTVCCHLDVDHGITVKECVYNKSNEQYETEGLGFMLLPMQWRSLEND